MLKCRQCGWDKPNVLFPESGVVGYRSICKDCTNINRRSAQAGEALVNNDKFFGRKGITDPVQDV